MTTSGLRLIKLHGQGQGCGTLVAEIIAHHLSACLGLPVLEPQLTYLHPHTPTEDKNDELADLLEASSGLNLAFPFLASARPAMAEEYQLLGKNGQAACLWLDRFLLNPDRNSANPNLLFSEGRIFLIDFGSALHFQYQWSRVNEETPRQPVVQSRPHLFEEHAQWPGWPELDADFAARISREILHGAVGLVPDDFLLPLLPAPGTHAYPEQEMLLRRRAAYEAFLWKRLKAPRAFALQPAELRPSPKRGRPPRLLNDFSRPARNPAT